MGGGGGRGQSLCPDPRQNNRILSLTFSRQSSSLIYTLLEPRLVEFGFLFFLFLPLFMRELLTEPRNGMFVFMHCKR